MEGMDEPETKNSLSLRERELAIRTS